MRITTLMPDRFTTLVLNHVLGLQPDMDVSVDSIADCDIVLVHASLTGGGLARLAEIAKTGTSAIVTAAPSEPATLARYLAAGARGYHRSGESLTRLLNVIREVYAGDLRYDPYVMACLLRYYRDLRGGAGKSVATTA